MTGLCQRTRTRKMRVTQLHTFPPVPPKSLFIIGSILGGLKPNSLRYTFKATLEAELFPLLQLTSKRFTLA